MNDTSLLSSLDKLLLELVFQSEQQSHSKEHAKEQIQIFTANALEIKQQIRGLHENISKNDDELFHLQKHSRYSKETCSAWKPAYMLYNKHEDYLQGQLQNCQGSTENDKKMYLEYMNQFRENLKQHQSQYTDAAFAQEYYMKKAELDDIQKKVLICKEKLAWKEATLMELLERPPFKSYNDWALQLVSLRHNTDEVLKSATLLMHKTSDLEKEAEELELKNKCFQQYQPFSQEQNISEIVLGDDQNKGKESEESMFEDQGYFNLTNEKHHHSQKLHLPCLPQKSVRPLQGFTLSLQLSETDRDEKGHLMNQSTVNSIHSNEALTKAASIQKCNDTTENKHPKYAQVPTIKNLQNHMQFRLSVPQKQTHSKQWFDHGSTERDTEIKETTRESKDSAYASQDVLTESFKSIANSTGRAEDHADGCSGTPEPLLFSKTPVFPRTPEPPVFPRTPEPPEIQRNPVTPVFVKTPELTGNKGQFCKGSTFEVNPHFGCDGSTAKSPSFSFLMTSTPKTPRFNLFESSLFGTPNSPEQHNESFSDGNINPTPSPQKDIGNLFGKMDGEDEFAFSFPSESCQPFGDGKDDFSFPFSFGQDQKSSQVSSFKGFQSSSQGGMQFTFF